MSIVITCMFSRSTVVNSWNLSCLSWVRTRITSPTSLTVSKVGDNALISAGTVARYKCIAESRASLATWIAVASGSRWPSWA